MRDCLFSVFLTCMQIMYIVLNLSIIIVICYLFYLHLQF